MNLLTPLYKEVISNLNWRLKPFLNKNRIYKANNHTKEFCKNHLTDQCRKTLQYENFVKGYDGENIL